MSNDKIFPFSCKYYCWYHAVVSGRSKKDCNCLAVWIFEDMILLFCNN